MKRLLAVSFFVCLVWGMAFADTFGTGDNQFSIDFVNISGDASSANGTNISQYPSGHPDYKTFVDPGDYRMGKFEINNRQWDRFKGSLPALVRGNPSDAYDEDPYWTARYVPTHNVSWYEAAQFVNWLNTSTNHAPAYKFSGTQGTSNYTLEVWQAGDNGYDTSNPYRNSNAYYFLPTEDEWVKAAYWNGTSLQTYATPGDTLPVAGVDTNYGASIGGQPWDVGSGSEELNGTFDMMGNVWEWMENPYYSVNYLSGSGRGDRGGSFSYSDVALRSVCRYGGVLPYGESLTGGFRVASVPEPCTLVLMLTGGLALYCRKR